MIILCRETKNRYDFFADEFKFLQDISDSNPDPFTNPLQNNHPDCLPFRASANTDPSATWKGLKIGGATKIKRHPCHCCVVESNMIENPNAMICDRWCADHKDDPTWRCYHQAMLTPEILSGLQDAVGGRP